MYFLLFVFLPLYEIYELGLMYLHYEIILKGYKVIYLGENLPMENLKDLKKHFDCIVFLSYFTIQPERDAINGDVKTMGAELLGEGSEVWLIGRMTEYIDQEGMANGVQVFGSISDLVENI